MSGKAFVAALIAVVLVAALTAIAFAGADGPAAATEGAAALDVHEGMALTSTGGFVSAIGPSMLETARLTATTMTMAR